MTREQLLPPALLAQLPKRAQGRDPQVLVKYFYPDFSWTWYGIEFDGDDTFFGFVDGDFPELGYFTLSELMANRGKLGCEIERDLYFTARPLSEIQK